MGDRIEQLAARLRGSGVTCEEMSREESWGHQQRWREVYCADVKARTGKWTIGCWDWNTFMEGYTHCLTRAKALHAFLSCPASSFLVVSWDRGEGLRCSAAAMPDLSDLQEVYVFPPDLEWTIVFSHEGPFFSRADWAITR